MGQEREPLLGPSTRNSLTQLRKAARARALARQNAARQSGKDTVRRTSGGPIMPPAPPPGAPPKDYRRLLDPNEFARQDTTANPTELKRNDLMAQKWFDQNFAKPPASDVNAFMDEWNKKPEPKMKRAPSSKRGLGSSSKSGPPTNRYRAMTPDEGTTTPTKKPPLPPLKKGATSKNQALQLVRNYLQGGSGGSGTKPTKPAKTKRAPTTTSAATRASRAWNRIKQGASRTISRVKSGANRVRQTAQGIDPMLIMMLGQNVQSEIKWRDEQKQQQEEEKKYKAMRERSYFYS